MPRVLIGSIADMRKSISRAALLVKVTASRPCGLTCPVWISQAMRVVSTRVLPEPAPARISADWWGSVTASSCCGLRPSRSDMPNSDRNAVAIPDYKLTTRPGFARLSAFDDQFADHRRQQELHRILHFRAGCHDRIGTGQERILDHRQKVGHVQMLRVGQADDDKAFLGQGYGARDERVGRIHGGDALEIHMGARELRRDVMYVVVHAPQNGLCHGLYRIATALHVAMYFLYPLQVDRRCHADQ